MLAQSEYSPNDEVFEGQTDGTYPHRPAGPPMVLCRRFSLTSIGALMPRGTTVSAELMEGLRLGRASGMRTRGAGRQLEHLRRAPCEVRDCATWTGIASYGPQPMMVGRVNKAALPLFAGAVVRRQYGEDVGGLRCTGWPAGSGNHWMPNAEPVGAQF
jgi:hypothetical protein